MNAFRIMIAGLVLAALAACAGGGDAGGFASGPAPTIPSAAQQAVAPTPVENFLTAPPADAPSDAVQAIVRAAKPRAQQPQQDAWGNRDPWTVTNELFNKVAEVTFKSFFPSHQVTGTFYQFWYRFYPETGCYVGVDMNTAGVHVLGCAFGPSVRYVGQLGQFYPPPKLYKDKVFGLWTDSYPHVVTMSGAIRVTNMTEWNGLGKDLFSCVQGKRPMEGGDIPVLCKDLATARYHELVIKPLSDELHVFTGTLPSDFGYTLSADGTQLLWTSDQWAAVQDPSPEHPNWGTWAQVANGWHYTGQGSEHVAKLYFVDNDGNVSLTTQKTPWIDGNIRFMSSYTY